MVDEDGRVIARTRRETPTTEPEAVLDAIVEITAEFRAELPVKAVGIGAAGFVDASQSTVLFAPHLAWRHEPLRDRVARRTMLPVMVDNDANTSGWAEWRFGAAQNEPDLVLITLGTGIGGALVIDGLPYRGHFGIAGEFGHMQVVPGGNACECGNLGCWEQYASGSALVHDARERAASDDPTAAALLARAGGRPRDAPRPRAGGLLADPDGARLPLGGADRPRAPRARGGSHRRGRHGPPHSAAPSSGQSCCPGPCSGSCAIR